MEVLRKLEKLAIERAFARVNDAPGPATDTELSELEAFLGRMPNGLKELLNWRNGSPNHCWFGEGFWFLLSVAQIRQKVEMWRNGAVRTRAGSPVAVHGGEPSDWIPFASWNADVYIAIDADERVIAVDFQDGMAKRVAASVEDFFSMAYESLVQVGEFDVDELMNI